MLVRDAVESRVRRTARAEGQRRAGCCVPARAVREAPERRHETRFVGRERELALLHEAWERAQWLRSAASWSQSSAQPGVGKSRLAAEALASIEARVVRGRCLPYGEGITYWPVVEVVKQLESHPSRGLIAAAADRRCSAGRGGDFRRRDRLGVPQDARAGRGGAAARRRLRRHPVGRGDLPRPGRARGRCSRPAHRSCLSALRGLSCASGARTGRDRSGSSRSRGRGAGRRTADPRPTSRRLRERIAQPPAGTRSSWPRWWRWQAERTARSWSREPAGAARCAPRPARASRAGRARARGRRRGAVPPRRRAGARARGGPVAHDGGWRHWCART